MRKILFILCLLATVIACNRGKDVKPVRYLDTMKIGTLQSLDYLPFLVAQQKGIYDSLGLKVYFKLFNSERDRNAAIHKDSSLDGFIVGLADAAIIQSKGDSISIVMQTDGNFYLIGSRESAVKKLKDLNLKNIAVSHYTSIEYFVDKIISNIKMSQDSICKPEINDMNIRMLMLKNGQIDAAAFPEPDATELAVLGKNSRLESSEKLHLHLCGLALRNKTINKKDNAVKALIQGYNRAVGFLKNDTSKTIKKLLIRKYKTPYNIVDSVKVPVFQPAQLLSDNDWKDLLKWLHNNNLVPKKYKGDNLFDRSYTNNKKQ